MMREGDIRARSASQVLELVGVIRVEADDRGPGAGGPALDVKRGGEGRKGGRCEVTIGYMGQPT